MTRLRELKLAGLATALEERMSQRGRAALSFEERLALLAEREVHGRHDRTLLRLLKNVHLKYAQATIEDIHSHAGHRATIITSQLPVEHWDA